MEESVQKVLDAIEKAAPTVQAGFEAAVRHYHAKAITGLAVCAVVLIMSILAMRVAWPGIKHAIKNNVSESEIPFGNILVCAVGGIVALCMTLSLIDLIPNAIEPVGGLVRSMLK